MTVLYNLPLPGSWSAHQMRSIVACKKVDSLKSNLVLKRVKQCHCALFIPHTQIHASKLPETLACPRINHSLALDWVLEDSSGKLNNTLYENHSNKVSFCFLLTFQIQMLAIHHFCKISFLYSCVYITYFSLSMTNNCLHVYLSLTD